MRMGRSSSVILRVSASDTFKMTAEERRMRIDLLTQQMKEAAAELEFEVAARLRDMITELQKTSQDAGR